MTESGSDSHVRRQGLRSRHWRESKLQLDWQRNRLFVPPSGLSEEEWQQWYADVLAPTKAAGFRIIVVRFVSPTPEPPAGSVSLAQH